MILCIHEVSKSIFFILFLTSVSGRHGDDRPTHAYRPRGAIQRAVQSGDKSVVLVVGFVEPPGGEQRAGHEDYRNYPAQPNYVLFDRKV